MFPVFFLCCSHMYRLGYHTSHCKILLLRFFLVGISSPATWVTGSPHPRSNSVCCLSYKEPQPSFSKTKWDPFDPFPVFMIPKCCRQPPFWRPLPTFYYLYNELQPSHGDAPHAGACSKDTPHRPPHCPINFPNIKVRTPYDPPTFFVICNKFIMPDRCRPELMILVFLSVVASFKDA
jgi:hypothetical protein